MIHATAEREARLARSCARMGYKLVPATARRYNVIREGGAPVRARLTLSEVDAWIRERVRRSKP